jgi:hypothetical protein
VVSAEVALRRAQLVEVDRQFCDLVARCTSLAGQVPAVPVGTTDWSRLDQVRNRQTVTRFWIGDEGRALGLLLVGLARATAGLALAGAWLAARISGRVAVAQERGAPA